MARATATQMVPTLPQTAATWLALMAGMAVLWTSAAIDWSAVLGPTGTDVIRPSVILDGPLAGFSTQATGRSQPPALAAGEPAVSVRYGGLRWALTGARLIPRTEAVSSRPIVVVELALISQEQDQAVRARRADVSLVWPDGRRTPVDRFEHVEDPRSVLVGPGEAAPVTVVFKPTVNVDPELGELTVEIGEPGRVPALIPLGGPIPADPDPVRLDHDGTAAVVDGLAVAPVTGRVNSAVLDVEAGPYRVSVGERVLEVEVDLAGADRLHDRATRSGGGFWSLVTPAGPVDPAKVRVEPSGQDGRLVASLVFVVDDEPGPFTLLVGSGSEPTAFDLGEG